MRYDPRRVRLIERNHPIEAFAPGGPSEASACVWHTLVACPLTYPSELIAMVCGLPIGSRQGDITCFCRIRLTASCSTPAGVPTGDSWRGSFGGSTFRRHLRQRGGDSLIDLWVTLEGVVTAIRPLNRGAS